MDRQRKSMQNQTQIFNKLMKTLNFNKFSKTLNPSDLNKKKMLASKILIKREFLSHGRKQAVIINVTKYIYIPNPTILLLEF